MSAATEFMRTIQLADQVDLLCAALAAERTAHHATRAERGADQATIRRLREDLDGMHLCNETLWQKWQDALREVDALRRELREAGL